MNAFVYGVVVLLFVASVFGFAFCLPIVLRETHSMLGAALMFPLAIAAGMLGVALALGGR